MCAPYRPCCIFLREYKLTFAKQALYSLSFRGGLSHIESVPKRFEGYWTDMHFFWHMGNLADMCVSRFLVERGAAPCSALCGVWRPLRLRRGCVLRAGRALHSAGTRAAAVVCALPGRLPKGTTNYRQRQDHRQQRWRQPSRNRCHHAIEPPSGVTAAMSWISRTTTICTKNTK